MVVYEKGWISWGVFGNLYVCASACRVCCLTGAQVVLGLSPPAAAPQLQSDTARTADQNLELLMQRHQQHQQALQSGGSASALNRAASSNASLGSGSQQATSAAAGGAAGGDDQQQQQAAGSDTGAGPVSSSGTAAQPSPKQQQLVSPTAMPMPRMSNAFARKHGLDPKENPLINLQRLAMQQVAPPAPSMVRVLLCWLLSGHTTVLDRRLEDSWTPRVFATATSNTTSSSRCRVVEGRTCAFVPLHCTSLSFTNNLHQQCMRTFRT